MEEIHGTYLVQLAHIANPFATTSAGTGEPLSWKRMSTTPQLARSTSSRNETWTPSAWRAMSHTERRAHFHLLLSLPPAGALAVIIGG